MEIWNILTMFSATVNLLLTMTQSPPNFGTPMDINIAFLPTLLTSIGTQIQQSAEMYVVTEYVMSITMLLTIIVIAVVANVKILHNAGIQKLRSAQIVLQKKLLKDAT